MEKHITHFKTWHTLQGMIRDRTHTTHLLSWCWQILSIQLNLEYLLLFFSKNIMCLRYSDQSAETSLNEWRFQSALQILSPFKQKPLERKTACLCLRFSSLWVTERCTLARKSLTRIHEMSKCYCITRCQHTKTMESITAHRLSPSRLVWTKTPNKIKTFPFLITLCLV